MYSLAAWTLGVVFPSTPTLPGLDRIDPTPLLRQIDREATWTIRATMWASVLVFCATPLLTVYLPLPAFLLPKGLLDRHANALATSRFYLIRQIMLMLKTIGGLCWGAAPEVRARLTMPLYPADTGGWRRT